MTGPPPPYDYQSNWQLIHDRFLAALEGVRNALITAGIPGNRVTLTEMDTDDLRLQLEVRRPGKPTLTMWLEFSDASHLGGPANGSGVITLYVRGGQSEIITSYSAGAAVSYMEQAGMDVLFAKLTQAEESMPEVVSKARAFLGA